MSDFFSYEISLVKKNEINITPVDINGNNTLSNLNEYTKSFQLNDTLNSTTKNGMLVLRCPDSLFLKKNPILNDEHSKSRYLVQARMKQQNAEGQLFRFEISKATAKSDSNGLYVSLDLTGYDIRLQEFLDSENHRFQTPKESFQNRVSNFLAGRNLSERGIKITDQPAFLDLPDNPSLKQNWLLESPQKTSDILNEIITRISKPEITGSTNEDWYYEVVPTRDDYTESFNLVATTLGVVDSGVMVTPDNDTINTEITSVLDNTKWKNIVIAKGRNGGHSLPMPLCRYSSDLMHAKFAPVHDSSQQYAKGSLVKSGNSYYKCLKDTVSTIQISQTEYWQNLKEDTRGAEWTNSKTAWQNNMTPAHEGYEGMFHDFNIVKAVYDRDDILNDFEEINIKDVIDVSSTPPDHPLQGQRYLIYGGTGQWSGKDGRIAQWDTSVFPAQWQYSREPREGDVVRVTKLGREYAYTASGWITIWKLSAQYSVTSPFHPVRKIELVDDHWGRKNSAIRFRFDWIGTGIGADLKNAASRWAGFNILLPFGIGDYKIEDSVLDITNLDHSIHDGSKKSWNEGVYSESLGTIRSLDMWLKLDFENVQDKKIAGKADVPMIVWFRDLFDRITITKIQVRSVGAFQKVTIPVGEGSNFQVHDSRIDELKSFRRYVFDWNYLIKERELTGVKFDWTKVREFGVCLSESYDKNLFYNAAQNEWHDRITSLLRDTASTLAQFVGHDEERYLVDHVYLSVAGLHFRKDAYVTSTDQKQDSPRMKMIHVGDQHDYYNLKQTAKKTLSRQKYHPELHIIESRGNVRLKAGQRFKLESATGPDKELVALEVSHIVNADGYYCVTKAMRKFAA